MITMGNNIKSSQILRMKYLMQMYLLQQNYTTESMKIGSTVDKNDKKWVKGIDVTKHLKKGKRVYKLYLIFGRRLFHINLRPGQLNWKLINTRRYIYNED